MTMTGEIEESPGHPSLDDAIANAAALAAAEAEREQESLFPEDEAAYEAARAQAMLANPRQTPAEAPVALSRGESALVDLRTARRAYRAAQAAYLEALEAAALDAGLID